MARRGENIRKRKDGRWEGRYTYIPEEGAKPKVRSVYAKSYREIRKKLADARRAEAEKKKRTAEAILFADIAEEWLVYVSESKKYSTYIKYCQIYNHYLKQKLKDQKIDCITADILENCFSRDTGAADGDGNLSDSSKRSIICVANQIISFAAKRYHITVNMIRRERQHIHQQPIQIFNASEQQKLTLFLAEDMDLYKFGIILCLYTGLRIGELCALKWTDIDMDNRIIRVSSTVQRLPAVSSDANERKTKLLETEPKSYYSKREIPICDILYPLLKKFFHTEKYVIGREKLTDPRTYQKKFADYLKDAEIEYRSFHTLRHTFASNCAACGTDAKALSEMLGHSSVQITLNRYVHPSMTTKRSYLNLLHADFSGQEMGHVS